MGGTTYKVHLDGYNHLDHLDRQDGEIGPPGNLLLRRDRPDGRARGRLEDAHRRQAGGSWWNEKYYPSVPYLFNLLMDPMEKMDPESHEWGMPGAKFFAQKMWAPTAGRVHRASI